MRSENLCRYLEEARKLDATMETEAETGAKAEKVRYMDMNPRAPYIGGRW